VDIGLYLFNIRLCRDVVGVEYPFKLFAKRGGVANEIKSKTAFPLPLQVSIYNMGKYCGEKMNGILTHHVVNIYDMCLNKCKYSSISIIFVNKHSVNTKI
jgi:hypothetical protein